MNGHAYYTISKETLAEFQERIDKRLEKELSISSTAHQRELAYARAYGALKGNLNFTPITFVELICQKCRRIFGTDVWTGERIQLGEIIAKSFGICASCKEHSE